MNKCTSTFVPFYFFIYQKTEKILQKHLSVFKLLVFQTGKQNHLKTIFKLFLFYILYIIVNVLF